MSDLLVGMSEGALNKWLSGIYSKPAAQSKVFKGSMSVSGQTVSWDIGAAPTATLAGPSDPIWDNWPKSLTHNGTPQGSAAPPDAADNPVAITFTNFSGSVSGSGGSGAGGTAPQVIVYATAQLQATSVSIVPLSAWLDESAVPAWSQLTLNAIIGAALSQAQLLLGAIHTPQISYGGVTFGAAALTAADHKVGIAANLQGKPAAPAPAAGDLPGDEFYVVLSREALQRVADIGMQQLNGQSASKSGSYDAGIFKASYSGRVTLDRASATPQADPTQMAANVVVSASASAGVDIFGGIIGGLTDTGEAIGKGFEAAGDAISGAFDNY